LNKSGWGANCPPFSGVMKFLHNLLFYLPIASNEARKVKMKQLLFQLIDNQYFTANTICAYYPIITPFIPIAKFSSQMAVTSIFPNLRSKAFADKEKIKCNKCKFNKLYINALCLKISQKISQKYL
jgi:hypothetical protein